MFRRFAVSKSGAAAVVFGIALLPLVLGAGAAIDLHRISSARTALQAAVDAGAIAAARNSDLTLSAREKIAKSTVQSNLAALAVPFTPTISVTAPSLHKVEVSANTSIAMSVMKLMRLNFAPITVNATAEVAPASIAGNVCMLVKSTTASPALNIFEESRMFAPTCQIHVASLAQPGANFQKATTLNAAKICVASSAVNRHDFSTQGNLQKNCAAAADPFEGHLPVVSSGVCTVSDQHYAGSVTLSPGVYCGSFNFDGAGVITLQPGLYVLQSANWTLPSGSSITGSDVTFYFADQNSYVKIEPGSLGRLSAPTTGLYKNILMFEPLGLPPTPLRISGAPNHEYRGLIYLPSRNVNFNMAGTIDDLMTIVVNTATLGTDGWTLRSSPDHQIPVIQTGPPRLVD